MSRLRTSVDVGTEEAKKRVVSGLEEHKAMGTLAAKGPVLVGSLHAGENRIWGIELAWMVLKVVDWGRHH